MFRYLIGLFVLLHGLVHLWYFTLSQRLVPFQPEMGWTGRSWALSGLLGDAATRALASGLYVLTTLVFVVGGAGIFLGAEWWRPVTLGAAVLSSAVILLFWDGGVGMPVQKGALGVVINLLLVLLFLVLNLSLPGGSG